MHTACKSGLTTGKNFVNIMRCHMFINTSDQCRGYGEPEISIIPIKWLNRCWNKGACYYVKEGLSNTRFLGITHLDNAHADGKFAATKTAIVKIYKPIALLIKRMSIVTFMEHLYCVVVILGFIQKYIENNQEWLLLITHWQH